jgi:hypothetical protein
MRTTATVIIGLVVLSLALGVASSSCAGRSTTRPVAALVDCTIGAAKQNADEVGPVLEQVIRDATSPDGAVNWPRVRSAAEALGWDVAQCALAAAVVRLLDPGPMMRAVPGPSAESVRDGWERLRGEVLGGRRYRVADGGVL